MVRFLSSVKPKKKLWVMAPGNNTPKVRYAGMTLVRFLPPVKVRKRNHGRWPLGIMPKSFGSGGENIVVGGALILIWSLTWRLPLLKVVFCNEEQSLLFLFWLYFVITGLVDIVSYLIVDIMLFNTCI